MPRHIYLIAKPCSQLSVTSVQNKCIYLNLIIFITNKKSENQTDFACFPHMKKREEGGKGVVFLNRGRDRAKNDRKRFPIAARTHRKIIAECGKSGFVPLRKMDVARENVRWKPRKNHSQTEEFIKSEVQRHPLQHADSAAKTPHAPQRFKKVQTSRIERRQSGEPCV